MTGEGNKGPMKHLVCAAGFLMTTASKAYVNGSMVGPGSSENAQHPVVPGEGR